VRGYGLSQFAGAFKRYRRPPRKRPKGADAPVRVSANGTERGLSNRQIQEHAEWGSGSV
jgi:hypothetical protein